jgi:hypothetical protein
MANTFILHPAITSSSVKATAELSVPLLARFPTIAIHGVGSSVSTREQLRTCASVIEIQWCAVDPDVFVAEALTFKTFRM